MFRAETYKKILLARRHSSLSQDQTIFLTRHTPATVCRLAGVLWGSDGFRTQDVAFPR